MGHLAKTYIKPLTKDSCHGKHLNLTFLYIYVYKKTTTHKGSICRSGVHHQSYIAPLYHGGVQRLLQHSLCVAKYSLKWKCSYSLMKPSAQIRHKSHSVPFCPFNHFSVWCLAFVCSANMLTYFLFLFFLPSVLWKKFENMKPPEFFHHLWDGVNRTHVSRQEYHFSVPSTWFSGVDARTQPWLTYHRALMQISMNK